jgi:hypothetical protein
MKREKALARPSATGIRNREEAGSSRGPRPDGANQPKRLRSRGNGTSAPATAEPSGGSKRACTFDPARSALGLPGPWDCPTQGRIRPSRVQRGPLRGSGRSAAALCAAAALCTQHSAHTLRGVQSAALRQAPVATRWEPRRAMLSGAVNRVRPGWRPAPRRAKRHWQRAAVRHRGAAELGHDSPCMSPFDSLDASCRFPSTPLTPAAG